MLENLLKRVGLLLRQPDLLLIVVFSTILLMMVLPLPSLLMDVLITLNITASIVILIMALQLKAPVHFSTFPSLLLVTTLFRLAISISTTRLILLEGSAGQIVETFGNVVVGGNLVVGLVIFLIITVVQFLVITKGADRVAEVGARFTLDAMPGKQMSVDADVRAGSLDQDTAKETRSLLEREAKLFGSMDGAMKFVKGDATAGLVITAINLIGGVAIGMSQFSFSFSEALSLYALLTIGDGLVAQIPALLISVAAGTIVTRVTNPNGADLGTEISQQITANHRTLILAGIVIAFFGFIPGFPTLIFMAVGISMTAGVIWSSRRARNSNDQEVMTWNRIVAFNQAWCRNREKKTGESTKVLIRLPGVIRQYSPQVFYRLLLDTRKRLEQEFGVPMGIWQIEINSKSLDEFSITVGGETILNGRVYPDLLFVKANAAYLEALEIPSARHFGLNEATLVTPDYAERLKEEKIPSFDNLALIVMEIRTTVAKNLRLFMGLRETNLVLDGLRRSNPHLMRDLREAMSVNQISTILRLFLEERVPFTVKHKVLEAILEWAPRRTDPFEVLQQVRLAISEFLTERYAPERFLQCIVISPTLESFIREGFRSADDQRYLIIENSISTHIASEIKRITDAHYIRGQDPVLLTQQDVRRALHNVLDQHGLFIPVLAYQEILPETVIYPVGFIAPENAEAVA